MRTTSLADVHELLRGPVRVLDNLGSPDSLILRYAALGLHQLANRVERKVRRLDRLFWHRVRMARFGPDVHFATNREIEPPYRVGHAVILHLEPFRTGVVIGWYGKTRLEEFEALTRAVRPQRPPTKQELDNYDERKLHGPGKPTGLRFSTAGSGASRPGSGYRVAGPDDAGAS